MSRDVFWNIFWKRNITLKVFWVDNRGNYQVCKITCCNQGHATFFQIFTFVEIYLLSHMNLLKWIFHYFAKMDTNCLFLPFFHVDLFLFFAFLIPVEGCNAKTKFIFPYFLCFCKWRHHINVALHALPYKMFSSTS